MREGVRRLLFKRLCRFLLFALCCFRVGLRFDGSGPVMSGVCFVSSWVNSCIPLAFITEALTS